MVRVKICGITNTKDALAAAEFGASAVGFNFYEKSPRVISPAAAWEIIRKLPPLVSPIGVFVNWRADAVTALANSLRLTTAQLHGDETPETVAEVADRVQAIKALHIGKGTAKPPFSKYRAASAFLLDAAHSGEYGGTGKLSNWDAAATAAKSHRVFLAGGLTPENVYDAILAVRPYGVDVASGIESRPGKKDHTKLRTFFSEVDRANRQLAGDS